MRIHRVAKLRLRSLFRRGRAEAELKREMELHLEQLEREGGSREARLRFGSSDAAAEACRDARRIGWIEDFFRDLRHSLRLLRRSPAFTTTAVLSLALGIGANAVMFGVFEALVLRPLPVPQPGQIYAVNTDHAPQSSFPGYRALRDRNSVFASLFAYRIAVISIETQGTAQRVFGYLVTGNYWDGLGVQPAVGRFFTPQEDRTVNASPYAVLSYEYWKTQFGGDRGIIGQTVRINHAAYTVTGVAPPGFHGTEAFLSPELWLPMTMQPQIEGRSWLDNPNDFDAWVAGRLKPGVTVAAANANLATLAPELARQYRSYEGVHFSLSPPGLGGDLLRAPVEAFGGGVLILAGLVLLAACVNLAALLSARAVDRERDLAIRISIGAGRSRLVRQLLTEALVLAGIGGAAGCGLAWGALAALSRWHAPLDFPIQFSLSPDLRVFLFAFAITLLTALLFGAAPARQAWKTSVTGELKGESSRPRVQGWTGRDLLLPLQLALCALLVSASLVAARGLARSLTAPLGITPDGAAMAGYDFNLGGYTPSAAEAAQARILELAQRIPGVQAAAFSNSVPLSIDQSSTSLYREGTSEFRVRNSISPITYYSVSPGYFAAAGTRLLAGRDFSERDTATAPRVAIVNQRLARLLTGSSDAVGKRFLRGKGLEVEIVGVAEDGKYRTLTEAQTPAVFWPMAQQYNATRVLIARTSRPPDQAAFALRDAIRSVDPSLAVYGVGGMRQMLGLAYLPMRAAVVALGAFGALALMLAFTGIYGLAAYAVSRRTREIGIRMALGARAGQVLGSLFGRIGVLVAAGTVLGLVAAVAAAGILGSIVYGASSRDPMLIVGAVLAIAVVGLLAGLGPARRALRTDPVQSLRQN